MVWGLNRQSNTKQTLVSLSESEVRLFLVENQLNNISLIDSYQCGYTSFESLQQACQQWFRSQKCRGSDCYWLLSRKLYKTLNIKPPQVPKSELDDAIKWLIKDQIEHPLEDVLTSHYFPYSQEQDPAKLTAVVTERSLIENLIELTNDSGLNLISIGIDELAAANLFATLLTDTKQSNEKIVGFIDQDQQGLIYNFYVDHALAFTRHIKKRFFPTESPQEFSLENDNFEQQQDQFLLETQRTLDYCVSQVFRKPVDSLVLDGSKTKSTALIKALEQVTELSVNRIDLTNDGDLSEDDEVSSEQSVLPETALPKTVQPKVMPPKMSLAETGMLFSENVKRLQSVNFYQKQYQPKPLEFGFKFASSIVAFLFLAFIGYGFLQQKQYGTLDQQLTNNKKELEKIQTSLQKLQMSHKKKKTALSLEQQIVNKQNRLIASKQLLSSVVSKSPSQVTPYSEVLWALSNQKIDSLWLTKISLYPDSISLSGQTTKPKSIPSYISAMATDEVLSSQFEEFIIERNQTDPRVVNFSMSKGRYQHVN